MKDYGYAVGDMPTTPVKPKQAPVAPASTAGYGYASDQRSASDRAAPTSVTAKNKGAPAVPKGSASIGYSHG